MIREWLVLMLMIPLVFAPTVLRAEPAPSLALVLDAFLPGQDGELARQIAGALERAGYTTRMIGPEELSNPKALDGQKVSLLALPDAAGLPAEAGGTLQTFVQQGGDILALRAPLWQHAYFQSGEEWVTLEDFARLNATTVPPHQVFDFSSGIEDWQPSSDDMERPKLYEVVVDAPAPGQRALRARTTGTDVWDTIGVVDMEQPFPEGHTLTVLSAKGDAHTTQMLVEWAEKDGSRWIATIPLDTKWRRYILRPEDFKYWTSTPTRGGRGDVFKPENAERFGVGVAATHMGALGGDYEYCVANIGTARLEGDIATVLAISNPPALDTLSPGYKLFESTEVAALEVRDDQAIIEQVPLPPATDVLSPHPRPRGAGYDKGRSWRFIPLVTAKTANGEWRGDPVTVTAHTDGPMRGSVWASFGVQDREWYSQPAVLQTIEDVARRMRQGAWFVDAGANYFTYFEDQAVVLGANVAELDEDEAHELRIAVKEGSTGRTVWQQAAPAGDGWPAEWRPREWAEDGYVVTAELLLDGKLVDMVRHPIHVWQPKDRKSFVRAENGQFVLDGVRWKANGVNYMPSSGVATEDGEYFEHWIGARSYDTEIIERDLRKCKEIGLNSVSIFIYSGHEDAQNLLDILRILDDLEMKANVSLRPGTPMDFLWPRIRRIIERLRLAENDTIFAYDLAWEPTFGHQRDRAMWDTEWVKWVEERYGSIAAAEADWGYSIPRDADGNLTNPHPHEVDSSGPWNRMTAAYRRFLDTLLYRKYGEARRLVLSVDPNHAVSFRMSEAANPTYRWDGRIPYDFPYLGAAVDILEPEAYGRIGEWERVRDGWFVHAYGRWASPEDPLVWAEMGVSAWETGGMRNTDVKLDFQGRYFRNFYKMMTLSGVDGIVSWFYPGGFRYGENSDYGIVNADGSDRPTTVAIREMSKDFMAADTPQPVDYWITIDRDEHPEGVTGIYEHVGEEFWQAIEDGKTPGLRTRGTGTTSADCPAVAVGGGPWTGNNPAKYLDGAIDVLEIRDYTGRWVRVEDGSVIRVKPYETIEARCQVTNLNEARWLRSGRDRTAGAVYIVSSGGEVTYTPLPHDVPLHGSALMRRLKIAEAGVSGRRNFEVTLEAFGRTRFGERVQFVLDAR